MRLRRLYLKDFRNYKEAVIDLCDGVTLVTGGNGQGKTSLLEALYYLATGRSFRTQHPSELVRHGASCFHLDLAFTKHGVEQRLRISSDGQMRRVYHNHVACRGWTAVLGVVPGVVMTPDDRDCIEGGPQYRRRFLDVQLAQADPLYVHHLTRYTRAMRQRNSLLRKGDVSGIACWEEVMAASAAYIIVQRAEAVRDLSDKAERLYRTISRDGATVALHYRVSMAGGRRASEKVVSEKATAIDFFAEQYGRNRQRELELGSTLVGPHRDDLVINLDDYEARTYASEGQKRSCVAAMRLAEWLRMKETVDVDPLMMIDDLGAALDAERRERLMALTQQLGQVFVTAVDQPTGWCPESGRLLIIENGAVATAPERAYRTV